MENEEKKRLDKRGIGEVRVGAGDDGKEVPKDLMRSQMVSKP